MYGQGYYPQPPPPRRGLSPLVIVLIVIGGVLVLGGGACVVLGGLIFVGAAAEADKPEQSQPAAPNAPATAAPTSPTPGNDDSDNNPSATTQSPTAPAPKAGTSTSTKYFCNATGWVRVCGYANVCSNQMVSGMGVGADQFQASTMAKQACENMARAKGGFTVCTVACSPTR